MWWIVYYDDGTTFRSIDGGPDQAPARGVQVIHQYDAKEGQRRVTDRHWYVWQKNKWVGLETIDALIDYLWLPGWKRVLSGRLIDREEYNRIIGQAHRECRFNEKRSESPWE